MAMVLVAFGFLYCHPPESRKRCHSYMFSYCHVYIFIVLGPLEVLVLCLSSPLAHERQMESPRVPGP